MTDKTHDIVLSFDEDTFHEILSYSFKHGIDLSEFLADEIRRRKNEEFNDK